MAATDQKQRYGGGPIQGWPSGMDNVHASTDLTVDVLRDALNVNISANGELSSRAGVRQVLNEPGAHSVFSDATRMVWVANNSLRMVRSGVANPVTLLTDVRLKDTLSWTEANGELYFSNLAINGKVNALSAYEKWGIDPPLIAPTCSGTGITPKPGVVMPDQKFHVTCTFVTNTGEESGAPLGTSTNVSGLVPVAILLTNIPQSSDSRVVATRIYVTGPGGDVFYREVDVPKGVTTTTVVGFFGKGEQLMTQFMSAPPPARHIEHHNGRIWMSIGNALFATEALGYGLFDIGQNFLLFPHDVKMLADVLDGIYVSYEGELVFLPDIGTDDVSKKLVYPYSAVEYAKTDMPNAPDVMAFTDRGFVLMSEGGNVKNVTEAQIAVDKHQNGCVGFVEFDGVKSIIAVLDDGKPNPLVSKDFVAAEAQRIAEL